MLRFKERAIAIGAVLGLVIMAGGCAPTYLPGCTIATCGTGWWTAKKRLTSFQGLVTAGFKQQQHLNDLAFPLLVAAAPICAPAVMPRNGLFFLSVTTTNETYRAAYAGIGITESLSVVGVTKNSGAERAGVRAGDRVLTIGGKAAPVGKDAVALGIEQSVRAYDAGGPMALTVRRDSSVLEFQVAADTGCTYAVVILPANPTFFWGRDLNAWVGPNAIYVTDEMAAALTDQQFTVLLAHEIAHGTMHLSAVTSSAQTSALYKNALAGTANVIIGLLVVGEALAGASSPMYTPFVDFTSTNKQLANASYSPPRERDADYLSLYLLARARDSLALASEFWHQAIATDSTAEALRKSTFVGNHPVSEGRFACMSETVTEIDSARASATALLPAFAPVDSAGTHAIVVTAAPAGCRPGTAGR